MEIANLDGSDRRVLHTGPGEAEHFGLTIYNDYVYWTDWQLRGVFQIRTDGARYQNHLAGFFRGLNDIIYVPGAPQWSEYTCTFIYIVVAEPNI